ncbi:MAG: YtxH domain-containing protein [Cyclobacteriaceae bacterium]|nr:YtxH domain-containing protein [Cyclobacteriaceae bacterium]
MNAKSLIGGLLAGAALGVAAGILLAPASGVQTRKKLIKGSNKLKDELLSSVEESLDALRDQFNAKIDRLAKQGKEAINHTSERVKV